MLNALGRDMPSPSCRGELVDRKDRATRMNRNGEGEGEETTSDGQHTADSTADSDTARCPNSAKSTLIVKSYLITLCNLTSN